MHEPWWCSKILKIFMEIVQNLGISFCSEKRKQTQLWGFGQLCSRTAQSLWQYMHPALFCQTCVIYSFWITKKLPTGSSIARIRSHERIENNAKNICSKIWASLSFYNLDMDYFATILSCILYVHIAPSISTLLAFHFS